MGSSEQRKAKEAWDFLAQQRSEGDKQAFKDNVIGAPALMMTNGLMQTLAYYKSKDKGAVVDALLKPLAAVVGGEPQFDNVMKKLQACSSDEYMRATEEALETLKWLRHFAKALAKG